MDFDEMAERMENDVSLLVFDRYPWTRVTAKEDDGELWIKVEGFWRGDLIAFDFTFEEDEVDDIGPGGFEELAVMASKDLCDQIRGFVG